MSAAIEQGSWGLKGAGRKLEQAKQLHGMRCCKDWDQRSGLGGRSASNRVSCLLSYRMRRKRRYSEAQAWFRRYFQLLDPSAWACPSRSKKSEAAVPAVPLNLCSALQPPVTQLLNLGYNKKLVSRYMRDERQPLQCLG